MQANAGNMSTGAQVTMSAVIGGTAEKLGGGKFANGAVTGAYVMMFNHLGDHGDEKQFDPTWQPPTELNLDQAQGYEAGVVSQSEFHNAFTPMENIGALGGYNVSFYSKTYQGYDGNWYVKTSATAYAPHAEKMSDKVSYFGTTEVIVGGDVISRSNFRVPSDNNSYFITQGHTWLGNAYNALPAGGNAQLRITISYSTYQFWNGNAYPVNPYRYIINYP
jgi:hypothetical protein